MKKIILLFVSCAMALSLAACADKEPEANAPEATPKPTATPNWSDVLTASASNAESAKTPPASGTDAAVSADAQQTKDEAAPQTVQEAYEKALACVGMPVEELYAAVGQPTGEPTYGPSCLQVDAEDGMLPYDGFSVWTVRSDTAETVHEVYLDE